MSRYRIKAYLMHETEHAMAQAEVDQSRITEAEMTEGYVMGVVDESEIKRLQRKGLAVSIVEKIADEGESKPLGSVGMMSMLPTGKLGLASELPVVNAKLSPKGKVKSKSNRRDFYVLRVHGTVTQGRQADLAEVGVKLGERLSRNQYTCELLPNQVDKLAHLDFVHFIRRYDEGDTLRVQSGNVEDVQATPLDVTAKIRIPSPAKKITSATRRTCIYSVRVHRKRDMAAVVKWLAARKRRPLWKHDDKLRVALLEDGRDLRDLVTRREVASVEKVEAPRLFDEHVLEILGIVKRGQHVGLYGDGEIIGVADTGIDETHPDLAKRVIGLSARGRPGDTSDPEGHGTHVAGCIVGDGSASGGEVLGAAPRAEIFFQSVLDANGGLGGLPNDLGELFEEAYAKGARIHNNSWGAFAFAGYIDTSLDLDRFVVKNPDMLIVVAAGNDGICVPRTPGGTVNADKGFVDYPSVASPATAKNGLTVGASRSSRAIGGLSQLTWSDAWPDRFPDPPIANERISKDGECLAAFSSRGPSDDNRIKPDVVAPGTDIAAARSKDAPLHKFWGAYPKNKKYGFMGGTSMAAPYVSGCAALVRQYYRVTAGWQTPSAALLKATLINGTRRLKGPDSVAKVAGDPNYHQGFGIIDMPSTIPSPLAPGLKLEFVDTWQGNPRALERPGQAFRYRFEADAGVPLRICLAWTDPPARGLQNGLVLIVETPDAKKFVGNAGAASQLVISGAQRDPNNNVQVVRFPKPRSGSYMISVTAGTLTMPPQTYALVVTGELTSKLNFVP